MRCSVRLLGALVLAAALPPAAAAQDPSRFYEENCATCHTIGGGVLGGPDLKGVTARRDREWLIRFLVDPDAFASDPAVVQMIKAADGLAMGPTEGMTRELAVAILALIEKQSGVADAAAAVETFAPFTPVEAARGRALFTGAASLSARGPACATCHSGGDMSLTAAGRLGPDLRGLHQRMGGAKGVTAWLQATQTPMMRALYKDARLTEEESRALAAFTETGSADRRPTPATAPHVVGGIVATLLTAGLIGAAGARRFRSVRRPLVARMRHYSQGGSR